VSVGESSSVSLRPAGPEDTPFLLLVYGSVHGGELAATDWTDSQKAAFVEMQFAAQSRYYREHYPDTSFDVIVLDGQPVGRLSVARWSDEIRIVVIALLPACCNRGLGTTLVRALQAEAAASRKTLRIHVERFNPALRLCERLGFRQIAGQRCVFVQGMVEGFRSRLRFDSINARAGRLHEARI
jgi:GNAT superfamily N-acetyltransferase